MAIRLKLTQPGFTTLTGRYHTVDFVNGIAEDLTQTQADTIGANILAELIDADGNTIRQAGEASRMAGTPDLAPPEPEEPEPEEPEE